MTAAILCRIILLTSAAGARTAKLRNLMAALTVLPMAKVIPPNKSRGMIPFIYQQLSISSISMFIDVLSDIVTSLRALHGVGTILLG